MNHSISNGIIILEVAEKGAEMMSIKKDGVEYLWQGNPEFWSGRACNLFPICGRLTDGKYTYKGNTYEMILHGFAKVSDFTLAEKTDNSMTFELASNEEIKKIYPFDFKYTVKYTLNGATVEMKYSVVNNGKEEMYFAFGGHPGFNVPLGDSGRFEDYYLEFSKKSAPNALVFENCMMGRGEVPFALEDGLRYHLHHDMFHNDAVFIKDMPDTVTLKSDKTDRSVTVHYPQMQYVGFWHKPDTEAPYVCIEPWQSVPSYYNVVDDFATKRDMNRLVPNAYATAQIDITLS